jgi:hypothetical protein
MMPASIPEAGCSPEMVLGKSSSFVAVRAEAQGEHTVAENGKYYGWGVNIGQNRANPDDFAAKKRIVSAELMLVAFAT